MSEDWKNPLGFPVGVTPWEIPNSPASIKLPKKPDCNQQNIAKKARDKQSHWMQQTLLCLDEECCREDTKW